MSLTHIEWGRATYYDKFKQKGRIYEISKTIVKHHLSYGERKIPFNHLFQFYIDSWFSSLKLMNQNRFYYIMSCSSIMKPKLMMMQLKTGTPFINWNIVNNQTHKCCQMCHHVKRKKYLFWLAILHPSNRCGFNIDRTSILGRLTQPQNQK